MMTPTQLSKTGVPDAPHANDPEASTPWPVVAGLLAGLAGTAGLVLWNRPGWNIPGVLVSSPLCGFIAAVGAWLVVDSWIDGQKLRRARADASFVLTPAWELRLSTQLIARYVASSLASICGAAAAFSRLTPERVREADIIALGWPLLAGVLVATIGAATSLTRNFQWAALITPQNAPVLEIPASGPKSVATIVEPVAPVGSSPAPDPFLDFFTTPTTNRHFPTSPRSTIAEPIPPVDHAEPSPPESFLITPPDFSGNDDR